MGHISPSRTCRVLAAGMLAVLLWALATLVAPAAGAVDHEVQPGENLTAIAERYGVSVGELTRLNDLSDPNHLLVGSRLRIPGTGGRPSERSGSASAAAGSAAGASTPRRSAAVETEPTFTVSDRDRRETSRLLSLAAREFGVSPSLLKALTYTESRWRQDVVSRAGAVGVGQLLPSTAAWLAELMDEPDLDPAVKADNIRLSARLLRQLLDVAGSTERALAAYYQGIGAVLADGVSSGGAHYAQVITSRRAWFR